MSCIFGIFALPGCIQSQGMLALRTLIKAGADDGGINRQAGIVAGNANGVYCAEQIAGGKYKISQSKTIRELFKSYKNMEGGAWSFVYGYHGKVGEVNKVITSNNSAGIFCGKKDKAYRSTGGTSEERLLEKAAEHLEKDWPNGLYNIGNEIVAKADPQSRYLCMMTHISMPHNVIILTRNCRSTSIKVFPTANIIVLAKGLVEERFKFFNMIEGGLKTTLPIPLAETAGLLLDIKSSCYTRL